MAMINVARLALTASFFGLQLQAMKLEGSGSSSIEAGATGFKPKLKIGGRVQDAYLKSFQLWTDETNPDYEIVTSFESYDAETMAAAIAEMTEAGNAAYVDVLICPYTSGATKACVAAVNPSYRGAILAWGGASDSIFESACKGLNCFGFFSVGSSYTKTGLDALAAVMDYIRDRPVTVGLVVSRDPFSASVAAGAEAHIDATSKLKLLDKVELSVAGQDTEADKSVILDLMSKRPDIVLVAAHNKDVEPAIIQIGKASYRPSALLATNALTEPQNYGKELYYANCVMMPTQWAESDAMIDPVIGWTSTSFKEALAAKKGKDDRVTYREAAAAASMVAVANAMKEASYNTSMIAAKMKRMDLDSFYGKLKWDDSGKIQKPMYTMQQKGDAEDIVAPGTLGDQDAGMSIAFPLNATRCWGVVAHFTGK